MEMVTKSLGLNQGCTYYTSGFLKRRTWGSVFVGKCLTTSSTVSSRNGGAGQLSTVHDPFIEALINRGPKNAEQERGKIPRIWTSSWARSELAIHYI